jgi:predicted acylesterase/phospholipase RssA
MLKRLAVSLSLALAGCAAVNAPINAPLAGSNPVGGMPFAGDGEVWVGLAFSGGGTRATAFGQGMVEEIRAMTATPSDLDGLLSEVRLVSGVSGGSVMAAWFGLHGPGGVDGFRDRYLVRDAERYMANAPLNPLTIARGLSGGANGRNTFGRFLDETLFHGATFGDLARRSGITTWINATDIANNVTFLFTPETFDALCSDLSKLPLSEAVAASAAFPLVFSPVVLESRPGTCGYREPDWLTAARFNPEATQAMRAHARALESYADPAQGRFVKLLDGGITDNFGTTGLAVERARAQLPFAPLTAEQAVRLKRLLFLVSDAGVEKDHDWTSRARGPGGVALGAAIARAAMSSATRSGYDAMRLELEAWQRDLVDYRCALSPGEVARLRGSSAGWDCEDVKLFIGQISFQDVDPAMKERLDKVKTRLRLPEDEVDLVLSAARQATRVNPELNGFLTSLDGGSVEERIATEAPRRITPRKN